MGSIIIMPKKANIFESFSHSAIQQFKEAFGIMDTDKDGLLSASDLVAAFGAHGKSIGSGDAQAMLDEVDGPMNFTQMVTLFATKMAGGSDDDDVILASFEAFEQDGKIDAEIFRAQLMTFGNKFSASEVDDAFAEFQIDDGQVNLPENHQKKSKVLPLYQQPSTKTSTTTFLHEDSHTFCEKSSTTTDNSIRSIVKKHLGIWLFGKYDSGKILNI